MKLVGLQAFAIVGLLLADVTSAQLLQRRILQVRTPAVQSRGLPCYSYRSDHPATSAVSFGYGIQRVLPFEIERVVAESEADSRSATVVDAAKTIAFRFPANGISIPTSNGTIRLTELGGQIDNEGNLVFSAKLDHDGGRDTLLKSPYVRIDVDVQTSLSNQVTPAPDAVSVQSFKQCCRAEFSTQKSIRIAPSSKVDKSLLARNFESITHLRVQMTYYPEK